jgi:hypothetical protein
MLLAKEADTLDHLPRPRTRGVEAPVQLRILFLELLDPLRRYRARGALRLELLQLRLSLLRSAAKRCQLFAQMLYKALKLGECLFRTYAV